MTKETAILIDTIFKWLGISILLLILFVGPIVGWVVSALTDTEMGYLWFVIPYSFYALVALMMFLAEVHAIAKGEGGDGN